MRRDEAGRGVYEDEREIAALAAGFENLTLPPEEFGHAEHLTLALWYLARLPAAEAADRVRAGLRRFAAHHGSSLYHETITVFWLRVVAAFLEREGAHRPLPELANRLAAARADKRLVYAYYSPQLIQTAEAKAGWIEPDLKPFDF